MQVWMVSLNEIIPRNVIHFLWAKTYLLSYKLLLVSRVSIFIQKSVIEFKNGYI